MYGKSFEIWLANLILIYRKRKRQFNDCVGYVKLCSFSPVIKEKTTKKSQTFLPGFPIIIIFP